MKIITLVKENIKDIQKMKTTLKILFIYLKVRVTRRRRERRRERQRKRFLVHWFIRQMSTEERLHQSTAGSRSFIGVSSVGLSAPSSWAIFCWVLRPLGKGTFREGWQCLSWRIHALCQNAVPKIGISDKLIPLNVCVT